MDAQIQTTPLTDESLIELLAQTEYAFGLTHYEIVQLTGWHGGELYQKLRKFLAEDKIADTPCVDSYEFPDVRYSYF